MAIRVVLADEYELIRQGVRLILEQAPTIRVAGEAKSVDDAIEVSLFVRPDVIVADVSSADAIRRFKVQNPTVRFLVLSACCDQAHVFAALQAGADGYILKQGPCTELVRAVLALGRSDHRQPIVDPLLNFKPRRNIDSSAEFLSNRECEVLSLVAAGHTSKDIARRLQLSHRTVGNHRARIMLKLQVDNCAQAAAQALQNGLIALPMGRATVQGQQYSGWKLNGVA
jgi:DNA-binding NarL/FixJ family response regulator